MLRKAVLRSSGNVCSNKATKYRSAEGRSTFCLLSSKRRTGGGRTTPYTSFASHGVYSYEQSSVKAPGALSSGAGASARRSCRPRSRFTAFPFPSGFVSSARAR